MSLISSITSLSTQKYLTSKNLLFQVERVLQNYKKGDIAVEDCHQQICELIDKDGKVEKIKTINAEKAEVGSSPLEGWQAKPDGVFLGGANLLDSETSNSSITFVSDDQPDPVANIFDIYLSKPTNNFSSETGFNPFGDITFESSYANNIITNGAWMPPIIDWKDVKGLDECVILYRTHSQSRSIEETFLKNKLPYRLVSGTRFLDRKEIKDVMSMLKFLANGSDKIALSRFLPLVMEGVGAVTLNKIIAYLEDHQYPLAPKFQAMIMDIFTKIQSCWNSKSLIDMCKELIIVSGYNNYLKREYPNKDDLKERQENIGEIYSLMLPFDQDESLDLASKLTNFLAHISLMSTVDNTDEQRDKPKINLMSLHQSKGLEYETVFLVGCEDGLLPHSNSFMEADGMEEEVRLAYVGVTRSKKNLFLISADSRVTFGQIKANPPSRIFRPFLDKYAKRTK
jgi:UvrD-like helicase C-terminal domain